MANSNLLDERKGPALLGKEPRVLAEQRKEAARSVMDALNSR